MSAHAFNVWQIGEPITEAVIREIARAVNDNRSGYRFTPLAFLPLHITDRLVYGMCIVLDAWDHKKDFRAYLTEFEGVPDYFIEIALAVLPLIQLPVLPKDRLKPPTPRRRIVVPLVNRKCSEL